MEGPRLLRGRPRLRRPLTVDPEERELFTQFYRLAHRCSQALLGPSQFGDELERPSLPKPAAALPEKVTKQKQRLTHRLSSLFGGSGRDLGKGSEGKEQGGLEEKSTAAGKAAGGETWHSDGDAEQRQQRRLRLPEAFPELQGLPGKRATTLPLFCSFKQYSNKRWPRSRRWCSHAAAPRVLSLLWLDILPWQAFWRATLTSSSSSMGRLGLSTRY